MKFCRVLLSGLLITSSFISFAASDYGVYYTELKAFKKAPSTKEVFDEDATMVCAFWAERNTSRYSDR